MEFMFIPVTVTGGRKFQGFAYMLAEDNGYGSARLWDPATHTVVSATYDYAKQAVKPEDEVIKDREAYIDSEIKGTLDWCRSKNPSGTDEDVQAFARNCIRKRAPHLLPFFDIMFPPRADSLEDTIRSTIEWTATLKTRPCWMYGKFCPGGKPLDSNRRRAVALKALENKGLSSVSNFEELFDKLFKEVTR